MHLRAHFLLSTVTALVNLTLVPTAVAVIKPTGTFASSGAIEATIYENPHLRGVLVRTNWSAIEPSPGVFDLSPLDNQIAVAEAHGKAWSLAVNSGGIAAPEWLINTLGVPYIDFSFRSQPGYRLPFFWDSTVQECLARLADRLAEAYADNPSLHLVYIPQMTTNGLEGHLQGVNMTAFIAAGYTDEKWIAAAEQVAHKFASVFPRKALAFEIHEINGGISVPRQIIQDLWNDPVLEQRVGAAMWWISGKTTYQSGLIQFLTDFPGDVYGQVIGRSEQPERFKNDDYTTVFTQAKAIGMRYIEPWEYEFKYTLNSAQGAWDDVFADFNEWAWETYVSPSGTPASLIDFSLTPEGESLLLEWTATADSALQVQRSSNLTQWHPIAELNVLGASPTRYRDDNLLHGEETEALFYRLCKVE